MYQYSLPFSGLNSISFCRFTTFCWSIHQLMDIWVISTFWLLQIMLLWRSLYKVSYEPVFSSLECGIAHCVVILLHFLRDYQAVSHSSCSILHSHQQWIRVSNSPHPCYHFLVFCGFFSFNNNKIFYYSHPSRCQISHCGFDLLLMPQFYQPHPHPMKGTSRV